MQKYTKKDMTDIQKIGVIMFGLMGDVLIRTPVIKALKEIYPNASIIAIIDPIGVPLLENNDYVDELIVINRNEKSKFTKNLEKIKGIFRVNLNKFDLLVNLYNGGSSHILVALSGAKYRLAFCNQTKTIYNVLNQCKKGRLRDNQSLYSYMISIVEPLSSNKFSLQPIFQNQQETYLKMQGYVEKFETDMSKVYLLNLGASKEEKLMDMDKYVSLVEYIYETYAFVPAIVLNPGQEYLQNDFIEKIRRSKKLPFIKLELASLDEIASLMQLTKFIITPDTGLMHLAMAMDIYIYAIFTYTHPLLVDIESDKFISVYEGFEQGKLYQAQNISSNILKNKIDILFHNL